MEKAYKSLIYVIICFILGTGLALLYLSSLNNRYMFVNMEGENIVIDKWTRGVYMYDGQSSLSRVKKYAFPTLKDYEEIKLKESQQ